MVNVSGSEGTVRVKKPICRHCSQTLHTAAVDDGASNLTSVIVGFWRESCQTFFNIGSIGSDERVFWLLCRALEPEVFVLSNYPEKMEGLP